VQPPLNLFDEAMLAALRAAVADADASPRAGCWSARRGAGSDGWVDVHLFDGIGVEAAADLWRELLALVHTIEELPLPTVFAADGLCLTAAFGSHSRATSRSQRIPPGSASWRRSWA
jgi:enoyl-CoA hydratase